MSFLNTVQIKHVYLFYIFVILRCGVDYILI